MGILWFNLKNVRVSNHELIFRTLEKIVDAIIIVTYYHNYLDRFQTKQWKKIRNLEGRK